MTVSLAPDSSRKAAAVPAEEWPGRAALAVGMPIRRCLAERPAPGSLVAADFAAWSKNEQDGRARRSRPLQTVGGDA